MPSCALLCTIPGMWPFGQRTACRCADGDYIDGCLGPPPGDPPEGRGLSNERLPEIVPGGSLGVVVVAAPE